MRLREGLALTLPLLFACSSVRAPASLDVGSTTPPSVFVEQRGTRLPGVVELGPTCPAEVGVAPSVFFDDMLLIRLPPEVDGEQLSQGTRFARSPRPLAMGCEDGLAASVFVARSFSQGPLASERAQLFAELNFPPSVEATILRGSDNDDDVSMSLTFPDDAVWGSTRVYLRMFNRYGRVYGVGFMTDASSYYQLEPVFAASANTMLAMPG